MKVLGLIPARGGSKGLPRKNLLQFCGRPLIWWSINAAKESALIDDYYVTTEDREIADIALLYRCKVIPRPRELAQDDSTTFDVVKHALEYLDEDYSHVALLEPTSPLRKKDDIENAIDILSSNPEYDAIVSYGEPHEHPYLMGYLADKMEMVPVLETAPKFHQRQQYPRVFYQYGTIYVCKTDVLLKEKTFKPKKTMSYLLEPWQRFEIDDEVDFWCAEEVARKKVKSLGIE
jgi:CMP-N,N'-diacetyllegionaminic acid synthase